MQEKVNGKEMQNNEMWNCFQQGRGSMVRQMSSVNACLEHMIGDVLKQLHLHPLGPGVPVARHSVLPLFE